jgi:hypothetical protein
VPLPLPAVPEVIEIQVPLLVAVHGQLEAVVTVKFAVVPAEGTVVFDGGLSVMVHGGGRPVPGPWLMITV